MAVTKPKVKPVPKVVRPTVKAAQAAAPKGRAKPAKSVAPRLKLAPGNWTPPKPTPPTKPIGSDVVTWARAAMQQLSQFNPNKWGTNGPGYFQGIPAPQKGPSIWEIIRNARGR